MSNSNGTNGGATRTATAPLEQTLRQRRILLTGATGFLGKVFLSLLLRWHPEIDRIYLLIRGDRRLSLSRLRREILDSPVFGPLREHLGDRFDRYVEEKLSVLCGDITEDDLVSEGEAPGRGEIDAVVHCAGLVNFEASLEKSLSVNTTGVAKVIEFCRKRGAALLHVSTCYTAGNADGHRFEDDIPIDWCPNGRRNFTLRREIRDALAAIARVEAESHDQVRQADELHVVNADADGGDVHEAAAERWRKRWVEERLKEIGLERARRWGWPNTYSYSKSLGEQLVFAAQDTIAATVARPSVIESALRDPFPGWNQGVNTSAPLTYLSGRGYRFYPAKGELVLDIIPVDLAAHAMVPILAALLRGSPQTDLPALHLGRESAADAPAGRTDRTQQPSRASPRGRSDGQASRRIWRRWWSRKAPTNSRVRRCPSCSSRARAWQARCSARSPTRAQKFEQGVDKFGANTAMARDLVEVYRPYIQELVYTFHGANIRALYKSLAPADAEHHPYRPGADRLG